MWKTIRRKHCDDERLIAYRDGELPRPDRNSVADHLQVCWPCRSRAAQIEEQIRRLAEARGSGCYPSPSRVDEARRKVFAQYERLHRAHPTAGAPVALYIVPGRTSRVAVAFGACALAFVIAFLVWRHRKAPDPTPTAEQVLGDAREFERGFSSTPAPIHQVLRVEMEQSVPAATERTGRLEVWSDSGGERFAWKWQDRAGAVKHAVWRTGPREQYVYDPAAGDLTRTDQRPERRVSFLESFDSDAISEDLESAFLNWLRRREWRPVSFTTDFYTLLSREGVLLRVENVLSPSGRRALRLHALHSSPGLSLTGVLEVDAESHRPYRQQWIFETPDRKVELRVIAERFEIAPSPRFQNAVFRPDTAAPRSGRGPGREGRQAGDWSGPQGSLAEVDAAEIRALFALHRLRACLGKPVQVVRQLNRISVQGVVETEEEKRELTDAFAEPQSAIAVALHIQTVGEALREAGSPESQDPTPADEPRAVHGDRSLSIEVHLAEYLSRTVREGVSESLAQQVTMFSNRVIAFSGEGLDEAWALRRLAERYPSGTAKSLPPESRWLLEVMVKDHLSAFHQQEGGLRALLAPALHSLAGSAPSREFAVESSSGRSWADDSLALLETVQRMHSGINSLFAGMGSPPEGLDEAARGLLVGLARVDQYSRQIEAHLAAEFSARQAPGSK